MISHFQLELLQLENSEERRHRNYSTKTIYGYKQRRANKAARRPSGINFTFQSTFTAGQLAGRLMARKCVGVGLDCALSSIQRAVELCTPAENCVHLCQTATAVALAMATAIAG